MISSCRRNGATPKRLGLYPKEINGWFKALEIARVLFEDEGYHNAFINQIDDFIRREKIMYTPKIQPDLIPILYHQAKAESVPMTKLIDRIIRKYLEADDERHAEPTTSKDSITASF